MLIVKRQCLPLVFNWSFRVAATENAMSSCFGFAALSSTVGSPPDRLFVQNLALGIVVSQRPSGSLIR